MLTLKCKKHPRYTGKESPRAGCNQCYWLYIVRVQAEINRVEVKK